MRQALRLVVRGQVQGVGFRAWAVRAARGLGLSGWVRNRRDGSVEILAAGAPDLLEKFVAACRRGPPLAEVTAIEQFPADPPAAPGFDQAETA